MDKKLKIDIIVDFIKTNNLTKTEFCRQCKISTSTLYRIFNGMGFNLKSLSKIAEKMNINAYQFFN